MKNTKGTIAFLSIITIVLSADLAEAGTTTVTAPSFSMAPGELSRAFDLTLASDVSDTLERFTLILDIVPQASATGTLEFSSVIEPLSDYVFEGNTAGFGGGINTATQAGAFDTTNNGSVDLLAGITLSAITFELDASADFGGHGTW